MSPRIPLKHKLGFKHSTARLKLCQQETRSDPWHLMISHKNSRLRPLSPNNKIALLYSLAEIILSGGELSSHTPKKVIEEMTQPGGDSALEILPSASI